jgi:hypothetical protein
MLSQTMILQCIRGWQTESPRYETTRDNVVRIIEFRKKANASALLSTPSDDVDFFLDAWGSEVYGKDNLGHHLWVERVTAIKATELLARFDDDSMMDTRSVLMEALEVYKGNAVCPGQNTVFKHIYVMDLSGLAFGHFSAGVRRVVKNVIVEMGNLYPESVHRMMFVNAPFAFRAIWSMIVPWLHPVTKEKTKILGGGNALIKEFEACGISRENIPNFLGGSATPITLTSLIHEWREKGTVKWEEGKEYTANGREPITTEQCCKARDEGKEEKA